jgi:hypothetical protein
VELVSAALSSFPLAPRGPLQPPLAVQLVALPLLQVRCVIWPLLSVMGDAARFTVGAGTGAVTVTVADLLMFPFGPEQESV